MAFTVETGSIIAGANSYVSVTDADTYHLDRGNSDWAAAQLKEKQAALVNATDYIEQKYSERWKGCRVNALTQSLSWPRGGLEYVNYNVIPQKLKNAVCDLALEALSAALNPALDRGGQVKREKVDVIETEYFQGASSTTTRPAVDGILREYMNGMANGFNVPTVRV